MKIFITSHFAGTTNQQAIEEICLIVRSSGFEDFSFIRDVENFVSIPDPHELMRRAKEEIDKCDALLIEYDGPGQGIMIELGAAYALGKKIILITKKGTKLKKTMIGVTDAIIEFEKLEDIVRPMSELLAQWTKK